MNRHSWLWHRPKDGLRQCQKCGKVSTIRSHSGLGKCQLYEPQPDYKLADQERKDLKVKDEFGNWPDQSIQSRIAEVEEMAERTKESVRLDEIAKSNAIGMGLIPPCQTYTLNCDKCDDPYASPRAFPRPQLCDKCKPDQSSGER